jgi:hypothetical protein
LLHPSIFACHRFRDTSRNGIRAADRRLDGSIVIGYQGVAPRQYGGESHDNLVAVSMLREMGVLITAIMVGGRGGVRRGNRS